MFIEHKAIDFDIYWRISAGNSQGETKILLNCLRFPFFFKLSCSGSPKGSFKTTKKHKKKLVMWRAADLYTTIPNINLFYIFRLFVTCAISNTIAEKFTVNCIKRWWLPGDPHGCRWCIVSWKHMKWMLNNR
jgi:hypothetical protein